MKYTHIIATITMLFSYFLIEFIYAYKILDLALVDALGHQVGLKATVAIAIFLVGSIAHMHFACTKPRFDRQFKG
ncbi:MAG: hypothetical protein GX780_06235, partial [Campylobacteraceae bacterium]|nr:hypothetical protein [Campylobacteraceae bacterium]